MKDCRANDFLQTDKSPFEEEQIKLPIDASRAELSPQSGGASSPHHALTKLLAEFGLRHPHETAAVLMSEFGSVSAVLTASYYRLRRMVGNRVASILLASRDLFRCALIEEVARGPVLGNRAAVAQFLRTQMGTLNREQLMALYLAPGFRLLKAEHISDGSISEAALDPPKIIHRALDLGAQALVLVHNHPSGDATPSASDRRATARLSRIAADLDIRLLDHLIVAGDEVRSMMENGAGVPSWHPLHDSAPDGP